VKPRVKGGRRLWTTDEKLPAVTDYAAHARNAAAMWEALAKGYGALLVDSAEVRIVAPSPYHALRAVVLDPWTNRPATIASIVDTVLGESGLARRVVEDASGEFDLSRYGLAPRFRMTVMARAAGPPPKEHEAPPDIRVVAVRDPVALAAAERILISIFPPSPVTEDPHGRIQPVRVLGIEGWRVWLAYRDGVPAAAAYTYHDGSTLGLYQFGTLPEHRGHGIARALLTGILLGYPQDTVTLTATDQGRPLYESFGFTAVSEAVWWWPNHKEDDRGEGLR
jgi:GNAT superfamily N-acetyltransferase